MDAPKLYKRAEIPLERAITSDENKDYETARSEYSRACEILLLGIRADKNVERRTRKVSQVQGFLSRAEVIATLLSSKKKKAKRNQDVETEGEKGFMKVAGMEHVKQSMREAVILPMLQPQLFTGNRRPWRGVMLFGPPGTGKSYIAQALSEEANVEFVSISSSDIMSKWQGDSEKAIRQLFVEARKKKPCVIFIDEVDSIGGKRGEKKSESSSRVLTELLRQMEGVGSKDNMDGITVIGATNHPEGIDSALRRRFEKRLYVPMPGVQTRLQVLKLHFGDDATLHALSKSDFMRLAQKTKGYSNADLANIANEAMMIPVRRLLKATHFKEAKVKDPSNGKTVTVLVPCSSRDWKGKKMRILDKSFPANMLMVPPLNYKDVVQAIDKIKPSVSPEEIERHQKFAKEFGGDDFRLVLESEDLMDVPEDDPTLRIQRINKKSPFVRKTTSQDRKPMLA